MSNQMHVTLKLNTKVQDGPKTTQEMSSCQNNAACFRDKLWPNVKPFVNAFLAGQVTCAQFSSLQILAMRKPDGILLKSIPVSFLYQAAQTTAQFETFDFLKKWIKDGNGGIPLTLCQEACCGMISGGIASCISYPFNVAFDSVKPNSSLRSLLHPLHLQAREEGFLALWKGSGHHVRTQAFMSMGLLTSYNCSLSYFMDSIGLSDITAQIGAGIVSAASGAACGSTYLQICTVDELNQKNYGGSDYITKLRGFVGLMGRGVQPGGPFKFYSGVLQRTKQLAPIAVVTWLNLEFFRKFEESRGY